MPTTDNGTVIIIHHTVTVDVLVLGCTRFDGWTVTTIVRNARFQCVSTGRCHIKIIIFIRTVIYESVHQSYGLSYLCDVRRSLVTIIEWYCTEQCFLSIIQFFDFTTVKGNIEVAIPGKVFLPDRLGFQGDFQTTVLHLTDVFVGSRKSCSVRKVCVQQQVTCQFMVDIDCQVDSVFEET